MSNQTSQKNEPIEIVFVTEDGQPTARLSDTDNQRLMILSEASSMHGEPGMPSQQDNLMILSEASAQELVDGTNMQTIYITQPDGSMVASNEIIVDGEEIVEDGEAEFYVQEVERDGYDHLGELVDNLEAALKNTQTYVPKKGKPKTKHPSLNVVDDDDQIKPYDCDTCGKAFTSYSNFVRHRRIHTGERPYICRYCNKAYVQLDHLKRHVHSHTGEMPFVCRVCGKKYSEKNRYHDHLRTHTGEKPFPCNQCDRAFSYKEGLQKHNRIHLDVKAYECEFCFKRFSESSSLCVHRRIHTGERPHICQFCFKGFITKKAVKVHVRVHTGERPYNCPQCPRNFPSKTSLNSHIKRHDPAELTHVCNECGKRFTHASLLQSHQYTHSTETPFHCELCFKRYRRKSSLVHHMKMHDENDTVAVGFCYACDKDFGDLNEFQTHMSMHKDGVLNTNVNGMNADARGSKIVFKKPADIAAKNELKQLANTHTRVINQQQYAQLEAVCSEGNVIDQQKYAPLETVSTDGNVITITGDGGVFKNPKNNVTVTLRKVGYVAEQSPHNSGTGQEDYVHTVMTSTDYHTVVDSTHLVTDSTHMVTDSPHMVTDSTHLVTDSTHMVTDSTHMVTDSTHMATDSPHMVTDSTHLVTDYTHLLTDSTHPTYYHPVTESAPFEHTEMDSANVDNSDENEILLTDFTGNTGETDLAPSPDRMNTYLVKSQLDEFFQPQKRKRRKSV